MVAEAWSYLGCSMLPARAHSPVSGWKRRISAQYSWLLSAPPEYEH